MTRLARTSLALILVLALQPGVPHAGEEDDPVLGHPDVRSIALDLPVVPGTEPLEDIDPKLVILAVLEKDGRLAFAFGDRLAASIKSGSFALKRQRLSLTDAGKNRKTLEGFRSVLGSGPGGSGARSADGSSNVRLLLRADASAPWVYAVWLMQQAAASRSGVWRVRFSSRAHHNAESPEGVFFFELPHDAKGHGSVRTRHALLRIVIATGGEKEMHVLGTRDAAQHAVVRVMDRVPLAAPDAGDRVAAALDAWKGEAPLLSTSLALSDVAQTQVVVGEILPVLAALRLSSHAVVLQEVPLGRIPESASSGPSALPAQRPVFGGEPPGRPAGGRLGDRTDRRGTAIDAALRWLAAHQAPSGAWECASFGTWCNGEVAERGPDGAGKEMYDVGVTGLALLAFLGAGHTQRGDHEFSSPVRKGLQFLKSIQDREGCYSEREHRHWIYNHAVATCAVVEAFGMTRSTMLAASAQRALDFVARCRNPYFAWRYGVRPGDNDTSVTGWMLTALALARTVNEDAEARGRAAPLTYDKEAFDGVRAWLDKMTDPDYGRVGYIQRGGSVARQQELLDRFPGDKSEAMTAVGITLRVLMGVDPRRSPVLKRGYDLLLALPPTWNPADGSIDMYYWYWGSLAAWQRGGRTWKTWSTALDTALLGNQRLDTTACLYRGSWDPIGPWGLAGGRVYSTAILCLCLETPGRTSRRFGH